MHLLEALEVEGMLFYPRLDYPFSVALDPFNMHSVPNWDEIHIHYALKGKTEKVRWREWKERTGLLPQQGKTVSQLIIDLIHNSPHRILLFGKCSLMEPWITNKGVRALCMVRHPLYAYQSLLLRRHPQWARKGGGATTAQCGQWYIDLYNKVIHDFLESGNPIVRYEHLVEDTKKHGYNKLSSLIQPTWSPRSQLSKPLPDVEEVLREGSLGYFSDIWDKW